MRVLVSFAEATLSSPLSAERQWAGEICRMDWAIRDSKDLARQALLTRWTSMAQAGSVAGLIRLIRAGELEDEATALLRYTGCAYFLRTSHE